MWKQSPARVCLGHAFCIVKVWRASEPESVPAPGDERIQVSELFQGRRSLMNTPWAVCSSISICYYKTISLSPDAFPHADGVKRMTGLSLKMHNASSQTPTCPTVNILPPRAPAASQLDPPQNTSFLPLHRMGSVSIHRYNIYNIYGFEPDESRPIKNKNKWEKHTHTIYIYGFDLQRLGVTSLTTVGISHLKKFWKWCNDIM